MAMYIMENIDGSECRISLISGGGDMGGCEAVCRDAEGAHGCKLSRGGSLGNVKVGV